MYNIEWQGKTLTIGQEFALKVVEAVTMNTEKAPPVEEPEEITNDEAQTSLNDFDEATGFRYDRDTYVIVRAPHATGWRSHCSRCGAVGRKCLERLNGRCHTCKVRSDEFVQLIRDGVFE